MLWKRAAFDNDEIDVLKGNNHKYIPKTKVGGTFLTHDKKLTKLALTVM